MATKEGPVVSRRNLVAQMAPSCVLSCLVPLCLSNHTPRPNTECGQQSTHKFDQPLKTELTYREFARERYGSDYIPIMKALYDDIGRERLLGYATICHADYGLPQGFNPDIHLVREKTLMQGHDSCNHRFLYGGSDGEEG